MTTEKIMFADLGLNQKILDALDKVGYKHPTPIQEKAIPIVLMGRDVVGIAQTGTGKTASFTLPLLEILGSGKAKSRMPRALVLAPTRELAAQIQDNIKQYSQNTTITSSLMVGGESMSDQAAQLQRGVDILIATPGRLLDQFQRGGIILTDAKFFVIDEADRMLDMGFIPDIEKIASYLPALRQTLMFTATMPPEIRKLADKFLSNPKEISVARTSSTANTISQFVHHTEAKNKADDLLDMIERMKPSSSLVFCNRKTDVDRIKRVLVKAGHAAEALHGDMMQSYRFASLGRFKTGESKIIVCSDIAARGIDIDDVTHVFNLDIPRHAEDYVHRIGRTGRAGKTGFAVTFVGEEDFKALDAVQKLIQQEIPVLEDFDTGFRAQLIEKGGKKSAAKKSVAKKVADKKTTDKKSSEPKATEKKTGTTKTASPKNDVVEKAPSRSGSASTKPKTEKPASLTEDTIAKQVKKQNTRDKDDDETILGFGDDMPAFMKNGLRD